MADDDDRNLPARRTQTAPAAARREPEEEPPIPPDVRLPLAPYEGIGDLASVLHAHGDFERAQAILSEPIPLEKLAIKPTGEIYLPQVHYRKLLLRAFGIGGWGLRPVRGQGPQVIKDGQWSQTIMWPMELIVRGVVVAVGMGEASFSKSNSRTSLATAAESAKSDALVRACKDLGIASDCWDPVFAARFVKEHCVRVRVRVNEHATTKIGVQWRRKDADPFPDELGVAPEGERPAPDTIRRPESTDDEPGAPDTQHESTRPPGGSTTTGNGLITQTDIGKLMARCKAADVTEEQLKDYLLQKWGIRSRKQIKLAQLDAILKWIESRTADLPPDEPGAEG